MILETDPESLRESRTVDNPKNRRQTWSLLRKTLENHKKKFHKSQRPTLFHKIFPILRQLYHSKGLSWLVKRGQLNAKQIQLNHHTLTFPQLPQAFHGFRILHLSDFHFGISPTIQTTISQWIQKEPVDLTVISGDFSPSFKNRESNYLDTILEGLKPILEHTHSIEGVVAVLGNHDLSYIVTSIENLGVRFLLNETLQITRDKHKIYVTGLDDVNRYHTPLANAALLGTPEGFRIALVHSAERAPLAAKIGFDLYLCGHTHGGQICWPGGRPILIHMHHSLRPLASGRWSLGTMQGYTSRGAGTSFPPIRFNCPGEISILTLMSSD